MSIAKQLYQLQEVDLELESNEKALRQIISQLGESQEVVKTKTKLTLEQQHLEELRRQQHSTEWEIDDLTGKLITGHHTVKKDQSGRERANVIKFERYKKKTAAPAEAEQKSSEGKEDSWDD